MPSGLTYFYHIETYYMFIFIVLTFIANLYSYHFISVSYLCDCIYSVYLYMFIYNVYFKFKTNYIDIQYFYVLNYLCCYLYNINVFPYVFHFWLRENIFFTCRLTQETYSMLKSAIRKCFVGQQKKTIVLILLCLLNHSL